MNAMLEAPLLGLAGVRSLFYASQYQLANLAWNLLAGKGLPNDGDFAPFWKAHQALLQRDVGNIRQGLYPASVLLADEPLAAIARLPRLFVDGLGITRRRLDNRTDDFDDQAREYLGELPRYYRRNFHFQTNGYLSAESAELYEHQVEMLFAGAADAMRRLIVPPLKAAFPGDGAGLTFLEVGAGTGRATRFVAEAFPKARIVACDLSSPYLQVARRNLAGYARVDFVRADGAALPFRDATFDAAYSVFMHHELPRNVRRGVFAEGARAVRPGGLVGMVDSLQLGDMPELDPLLGQFPKEYHEPFYQDYVRHPVPQMMREVGLEQVDSDAGFVSKVCWGRAPASAQGDSA